MWKVSSETHDTLEKKIHKFRSSFIHRHQVGQPDHSVDSLRSLMQSYSNSQVMGTLIYEGHLESKERFAIKNYLLIIGKKKNMQVLSHTFTYFST